MNRQDQLSGLILLVIGLLITLGTLASLRTGTLQDPGPGLLPLMTGILLSLFSSTILIKATFSKRSEKRTLIEVWTGLNWPKIFYTIGALLIYCIILNYFGFLVTTLLLLMFLFRAIEPQGWKLVLSLSILASVVSYLIFDRVLQVQLPRGFLGF